MAELRAMEDRRARLRRLARVMLWVSLLLAVLGPVVLIAVWGWFEAVAPSVLPGLRLGDLSTLDRIGGYGISLVPAAIGMWGFLNLARLFGRFAQGDLFDTDNATRLRRFALSLLGVVPAKVVAHALLSVWLTRDAAAGAHQLQISLSSTDVVLLAIGMLMVALATVLREAAEIADENRQFV
ncbi:MAG: DUF2975 domain-containing protein [Thalassobaculaceae bacterium]|nr:DUF2975 domain-containing protein [Thalassobaculaceae bacterium]